MRNRFMVAVASLLSLMFVGCASQPVSTNEGADGSVVRLDQPVHFLRADGSDAIAGPGTYRVEASEEVRLRLTPDAGAPSLTVQATEIPHDLSVKSKFALVIPQGDDEQHVVLLMPDGKGLDAGGSLSGVRLRGPLSPLPSSALQQAALIQPTFPQVAIGFVDPCLGAGASSTGSSTAIAPVQQTNVPLQLNLPNPGSGPGPIADVTDWQPRTRVPAGAVLIIRGRNLDPNRLIVRIGDSTLTKAGSSPGEVRFQAPGSPRSSGKPLVVYHEGGQARTLEPSYLVFNPTVLITRVVPSTFAQGDLVTVCGQSLFHAVYTGPLANPVPNLNVTIGPSNPLRTVDEHFGRVGNDLVHAINPVVSPVGDRMTFVAGDLHRGRTQATAGGGGTTSFIVPTSPQPPNATGAFQFAQPGQNIFGGPFVSGPSVTWRLGGPKITKVYADPMRQFGVQEPVVILPTILPNNTVYNNRIALVHVEGRNLEGQFRIGNLSITGYSPLTPDGTKIGLQIPANGSTAPICGTKNNVTGIPATGRRSKT